MFKIKELSIFCLWLCITFLYACDKDNDRVALAVQFEPEVGRNFLVHLTVEASGFKPELPHISFSAPYGTLGNLSITSMDPFKATALMTPPATDADEVWTGEIPITARYTHPSNGLNEQITRKALILSQRQSGLGQPEAVPGLVNTLGVEDSPQVSPDGQWLIVGTYIPIDLGHCLVNGLDHTAAPCNDNDYNTNIRPGLFGADRIISSSQINHEVPQLNYVPGIASPPTSSFGFRRMSDGSFGDPFVLGLDMGGHTWNATNGFSFGSTNGSATRLFYSFNDPIEADGATEIYFDNVELGSPTVFGTYDQAMLSNFTSSKVDIEDIMCGVVVCHEGNPHITDNILWFDNAPIPDGVTLTTDLFYVNVSRDNSGNPTGFTGRTRVPVSRDDRGESMPYMDGDYLYYQCDTSLCRSQLLVPADPSQASSWGTEQILMTGSTLEWQLNLGRDGRIVAITEPSVANIEDNGVSQKWLYFGYILQNHYGTGSTEFGANWNVGRVRIE